MTAVLAIEDRESERFNGPVLTLCTADQPDLDFLSFSEDRFEDLREGIRYAMSWAELEGWIARARTAHEQGKLEALQVETLMEQAIHVSRCIPEP